MRDPRPGPTQYCVQHALVSCQLHKDEVARTIHWVPCGKPVTTAGPNDRASLVTRCLVFSRGMEQKTRRLEELNRELAHGI